MNKSMKNLFLLYQRHLIFRIILKKSRLIPRPRDKIESKNTFGILLCILLTGCSFLHNNYGNYVKYKSTNGKVVYVSYIKNEKADIADVKLWDAGKLKLDHVLSGSGARYSDGEYVLWNKGDKITLWHGNKPVFTGRETKKL